VPRIGIAVIRRLTVTDAIKFSELELPALAGNRSPPIVQGDLNRNILAPGVFGVVREGAGLLGYVAGFGVALLLSPIFQPRPVRQPGASVQRRTNVIPFPQSKRLPAGDR
jgi:hypothetical protein